MKKRNGLSWIFILLLTFALEVFAIGLTIWLARILSLQIGELISLGQLIVALLLIPLAVVAFWEAREAIAQSTARPRLRMAFLGEDGLLHDQYTIRFPHDGRDANRVTLAVENNGDAIAVWWQASFDLPTNLLKLIRLGNGQLNIFQRQVPMMMDTVGEVERRVVQSAGTVTLFPGPPVQIAVINASIDPNFDHDFDEEYAIEFELLTDRSDPIRNRIPLRIEKLSG